MLGQKTGNEAGCGGCYEEHQDLVPAEVEERCLLEAGVVRTDISKRQMGFELRPDGYMGGRGNRCRSGLVEGASGLCSEKLFE